MPRQRQRQAQEQSQEGRFITWDESVTFSKGVMQVNGAVQRPDQVVHWESTNGLTTYTTVCWVDPATGVRRTSCNCPGWTIKKPGQPRSCKHTRDMEGLQTCYDTRVDQQQIRTVEQAVELVPKMEDGRMLRSIMLD